MPVGTYGSVRAMSPLELNEIGSWIILGNTFHLWLRRGWTSSASLAACISLLAGTNPSSPTRAAFRCSAWDLRKITEEGVTSKSPINGDKLFLSPEKSMENPACAEFRHRDDF